MIEALKNGDEFAYEQIYNQYKAKLFAYLHHKTHSREEAKDLLQVVFLKLWHYRKSLSENMPFDDQLFNIARTVFIDYLRRQNRRAALYDELIQTYTTADSASEFDLRDQLDKSLSQLPAARKKIYELHRVEGYSYKEIAEMLSISVKSVDNNLSKVLKHLRKTFVVIIAAITTLSIFIH